MQEILIKLKRVLHFLFKLKTYRTFKNGFLLDFLVKRLFHKISTYFLYTFTIFFGDKYILEHFFSNFSVFFDIISKKVKQITKNSFINFFRFTIYVVGYIALIAFIIYVV